MDYCFDQLLEIIEQLNENKERYYKELFTVCMMVANLLVANCLYTKKIDTFINKMFKMADGFLQEYNKISSEKLHRGYINTTFENYRKKKDTQATIL